MINVEISDEQYERLQRTADKIGLTIAETLDGLLNAWFDEFEDLADIYIGISDERQREKEATWK